MDEPEGAGVRLDVRASSICGTDVNFVAMGAQGFTYGHEFADIATWQPMRSFDLVVCQSVLQYLDGRGAEAALTTLGRATRGLLYLEVPTVDDRDHTLDLDGTDLDVHWRTGRWYRRRLDASFREIGGGLWLSRTSTAVFCELELAR